MQLHIDFTVSSVAELHRQRERAEALGAQLMLDRSDDPEEPLSCSRTRRATRSAFSLPDGTLPLQVVDDLVVDDPWLEGGGRLNL